ncbi:MAG: hypothetical protein DHS20C21_12720 [Gemmatimonadota bacterium]|nr:MAG: hypothetical protein DHS20C21_12720 [Gemmatimonadota bacterium]
MKKVTITLLVGAATLSLASLAFAQAPQLNEIVSNDISGDDHEFIEICGDPFTDLSGYSIVEIEGDATSSTGTIDHVHNLAGVIGASGIYTIGHAAITCADELLDRSVENGGKTILLVLNSTAVVGMDIDADDDGNADGPIGTIVDAVGMGQPGDLTYYGAPFIGPDGSFDPAGVARCEDCTGAWGIICLDGTEPTGPGCDTGVYSQAYASPCVGNSCGPVSVDENTWGATKALYK